MKTNTTSVLWAMSSMFLLLVLAAPASAKHGPTDLLGLHPGMSDLDVQQRLSRMGEVVRGGDKAKQTWKLRDSRYEYLMIRYDADWKLHWATAFAREGGRRVRYRDVGDLSRAKHTGQHFYTWSVPVSGEPGTWNVVARGGDPRYLDSVSILTSPMRQALIVPPRQANEAGIKTGDDD